MTILFQNNMIKRFLVSCCWFFVPPCECGLKAPPAKLHGLIHRCTTCQGLTGACCLGTSSTVYGRVNTCCCKHQFNPSVHCIPSHLFDNVSVIVSSWNFPELSLLTDVMSKLGISRLQLKFEFNDGYEMMRKAWSSIEEMLYCFSRSS